LESLCQFLGNVNSVMWRFIFGHGRRAF
jgi:hypothetical protein